MLDKEKNELQKTILDGISCNQQGRLILAPRIGKTKLILDLIKRDKPKSILWVTPSSILAEETIPEEFIKWKVPNSLYKGLETVTWASLNKIVGHYDLIVLDEEQYITESNSKNLINKKLNGRIISMTGTATEHSDKILLYEKLNLKILYKIGINSAVDIGLLSNYEIKIISIDMDNTNKNIKAGTKLKPFMTTERSQYLYLDKIAKQAIYQKRKDINFRLLARRKAIIDSQSKDKVVRYLWNNLKGRNLFFCSSINQANSITDKVYHSKTNNKHLQEFINGDIDSLCLVNSGGTGFTYKKIDNLVIVQADSDKNGLTTQKICRTLLAQKDYKAKIYILDLLQTQDEKWVNEAVQKFNKDKVEYIYAKNFIK